MSEEREIRVLPNPDVRTNGSGKGRGSFGRREKKKEGAGNICEKRTLTGQGKVDLLLRG